ncbi:hypothetical protein KAI04_02920 [Candidatus Pacearchaeota archaeon]|nr:hypothetical protein [Candidatus Pacearchaeota archaeon]
MAEKTLESNFDKEVSVKTTNENEYLTSMMPETKQESYNCVSGCSNCVPCGSE